jgi:ferric-chelate reductase [NAD(P)H]
MVYSERTPVTRWRVEERYYMNLNALHKLSYGVYVVCSRKGDKINGQIANTVIQVTSDPPALAVSINNSNLTHEYIKESRIFTASVLCQDTPLSFIGNFGFKSGRDADKFEGINYKTGKTKAPVVTDNAVAYMEVEVTREVDVGTHTLFIGKVVDADIISDEVSMTYDYYHQVKRGTTPKTAPSYIEEKKEEK